MYQTALYLDSPYQKFLAAINVDNTVVITDENVAACYPLVLNNLKSVIVPAGEITKEQVVVDQIIQYCLAEGIDKAGTIIGFGGGVVTDLAGYVASIYKRGVKCTFVPTSIIGMVDAAIGGKNGINKGGFKNVIGTIRLPHEVHYDYQLLETLPEVEWKWGLAEVIKYALMGNKELYEFLAEQTLAHIKIPEIAKEVVGTCVAIKTEIVSKDVQDKGLRKVLNFGHTIGHAIEQPYKLSHGAAVSIGMAVAAELSEKILGFKKCADVKHLLMKYELPVNFRADKNLVLSQLMQDKKNKDGIMDFILLKKIGKGVIHPISISELFTLLDNLECLSLD